MPASCAFVMLSVGDRTWSRKSSRTFELHAARIGADMHFVTEYPTKAEFPFPDLPDSPGRRNKLAYACKSYLAWHFLELKGYERVVVVDDTCCIRETAPSIFGIVPEGRCGFTGTSSLHAEHSFAHIRGMIEKHGLTDIEYRPELYMNTGVMLYQNSFRSALHPDKICAAADLLYAKYPNQTLSYYLLRRAGVPMFRLSKAFNAIPAVRIPKAERREIQDIRPYMSERTFIFHITGAFRNRGKIVEQIANTLMGLPVTIDPAPDPAPAADRAGPAAEAKETLV